MSGIFDNWGKQLEDRGQEGGISALDLATLPRPLRTLMRLMLREKEMTYPALCEAAEKMGPRDRMSVEELDEALGELHSQGWLLRLGRGEQITYKVNLRRKRGSSLAGSLWDKLGSESESEGEEQKEEPRDAE